MAVPETRPGRAVFAAVLPILAVFLAVLAFPAAVRAASQDSVGVDIGVVLASNEGTSIDPSLASLKPKLQSMFSYSSYRMLDRMKKSLPIGATGDFTLPGNRSIRVTPASSSGSKVRLAVQIMEGSRSLLNTTLGLNRGGMVLVGGPSYQNGVLILLISAD